MESFVPPNVLGQCRSSFAGQSVSSCGQQAVMFLQLVAQILGRPLDVPGLKKTSYSPPFHPSLPASELAVEEADFVVVGGGSGGCVVANRLSEIKGWKVVLLEAGPEEPQIAGVPSFAPMLQRSSIDWAYFTQPSTTSCLARDDQRCYWARGRVLGGSSSINYMIYTRGNRLDYDQWAALGNTGWDYQTVLEYFKRSEDNGDYDINRDRRYHAVNGYQSVERFPYTDVNNLAVVQGWKELGLEEVDSNAEQQIGTMILQHTTRDGQRASTYQSFLRPIRDLRRNLQVLTEAMATRILIDHHTKKAFGVEYLQKGKLRRVFARKEVILSAGSINSPKLLMLSGIGPKETLQRFDIPLVKDLRVGFNLHDHSTMDGVVFALGNLTAMPTDREVQDLNMYLRTLRGPLSGTGPLQANSFLRSRLAPEDDPRPDLQISFDHTNVADFYTDPILTAATNIVPFAYYDGMMARPVLLFPRSRGYITLNDSDPVFGDPLIYANTFSERIDLQTMAEGCRIVAQMEQTDVFRRLNITLVRQPLPACRQFAFGTLQYWECVAASYTTTIYHPVGTCKMGPKEDAEAVVDPSLRVYGVHDLRVIDSSIMPVIMRGNTNGPTIMIAEKGSDLVKKHWIDHLDSEWW